MLNQVEDLEKQGVFLRGLYKNWGWVLALGIVFVVLGFVGLGMTVFLTLVTVLYFGILMLIAGVVQLVNAFRSRESANIAFHLLVAVLYGIAGIVIIQHPKLVSAFFTAVIAFILIFQGVLKIFWGFRLKDSINSWFWPFLSGIISLFLGMIILAHWPVSGLWVIGLFIAVEMIFQGWAYIMLGLAAKSTQYE